jgi:hypothetical protein
MNIDNLDYAWRMEQYSPQINQWAEKNSVILLDFDSYLWQQRGPDDLTELINRYPESDTVLIIEGHPFNKHDIGYTNTIKEIQDCLQRKNKRFLSVTANWDDTSSNTIFLPMWYFILRKNAKSYRQHEYNFARQRPYMFSCLNRSNYRQEKMYNYIKCAERQSPDWYITIYAREDPPMHHSLKWIPAITEEQERFYVENLRPNIPSFKENLIIEKWDGSTAMTTMIPGFVEAHINLAMEHAIDLQIMSEKSFKPFITKQIPLFVGAPGIAKKISSLGFDLFYDVFNHDIYDTMTNGEYFDKWHLRVDKIHEMINEYSIKQLRDIMHSDSIWERLGRNQQHFFSNTIDNDCICALDNLYTQIR